MSDTPVIRITNKGRAVVTIMTEAERDSEVPLHYRAADALADAGLLAPDLPEPRIDIGEWQEWGHKHGNKVTLHNGMVTVIIPDDISRDLTREEAQELAAWLNAAANYSQEGNRE